MGGKLIRALLLLSAFSPLFASGKKEEAPEPLNKEWTLCITAFDVSDLPPSRQILGGVLGREISKALKNVEHRFRSGAEAGYYQGYAWTKSRTEAAKALEAKRNERDMLLFRGEPDWRYRKNLKTVEDQIVQLEEKLREIEAKRPEVSGEPVFKLSEANKDGAAPPGPKEGEEYRFCAAQKADALLTGRVSEFHGRIFVSLRMFTLYTRSYSWEDSIIFSSEDLNAAVDELSGRLVAAVGETLPAVVAVHATPENAMVLINGTFAGLGEVPPRDRSPGGVEVAVFAENYAQAAVETELNAGEMTEIFIDLPPLGISTFPVTVPGSPGSSVYLGSLFQGYAPLTLEIPRDQFAYIGVETPSGETGSAVYQSDRVVRGSAEFVREKKNGEEGNLAFTTRLFPSPEEKRVERARRAFYTSYGIFWFVLPAALLTSAISTSYINAYNYSGNPEVYDSAVKGYYATIGGYATMGVSLAATFFFIFRYLYYSGSDAAPLARFPAQEAAP
ncbi:MAG: hypothetical protein LBQ67_08440 [Treponema sp.]|nr:hypothetical protein [Treponema sp.]